MPPDKENFGGDALHAPTGIGEDFAGRDLLLLMICTVVVVAILSSAWKFGLEEIVDPLLPGQHDVDSDAERWEFVVLCTVFALAALTLPAILVRRLVGKIIRSRAVAEAIFGAAPLPMLLVGHDFKVLSANRMFEVLVGASLTSTVGRNLQHLPSGLFNSDPQVDFVTSLTSSGSWSGEIRGVRPDRTIYIVWVSATRISIVRELSPVYVMAFTDITWRKQHEEAALRDARCDPLTGLPNRRAFAERLGQVASNARLAGETIGVLFVDLDGFKLVNDKHGHEYGDLVLVEAARRISACARGGDLCARLGGDEFVIIVREVSVEEDTHVVARRCIDSLSAVMLFRGIEVSIGASIGISISQRGSETAETLLRQADLAMYEAKRAGRGTYAVFAGGKHGR